MIKSFDDTEGLIKHEKGMQLFFRRRRTSHSC